MLVSVTDVAAVAALFLSGYATWKTQQFNERQKKLIESQESLNALWLDKGQYEALNEKKADVSVGYNRIGSNNYRVKVWNKGKADARNVRIDFPEGNEVVSQSDIDSKFPLEVLEQHQSVDLIALVHMGTRRKQPVKLLWADDASEENEKIAYLTL